MSRTMSKNRKKETRYVSMLSVWVPSAHALVRMMRYDRCCPATEVESGKIDRLLEQDAAPADHFVRLIRFAPADEPPAVDRWRSYDSVVLDERSVDSSPATEAELSDLAKIAGVA